MFKHPLRFIELQAGALALAGHIPHFFDSRDERPAKEQIHDNYAHGGGWNPFTGFVRDRDSMALTYPGDPALFPYLMIHLGDERVYIYPFSWVVIEQPNGAWEVARID
jgi:hypothetical protein